VHPILRAKCVECHGDNGQAPRHSSSNVEEAYEIARRSVKIDNIEQSYFIKKVKSAHWLNYNPNSSGIEVAQAVAMLTNWVNEGESSCPSMRFSYVSKPVLVNPTALEQYQTIRFDLSQTAASLKDTFFEINYKKNAKIDSSLSSFTFEKPRLTSLQHFNLQGFYILINGKFSSLENIFSNLNTTINAKEFDVSVSVLPGMTLSNRASVVLDEQNLPTTAIAIGFTGMKAAASGVACHNAGDFDSLLKPLIVEKCLSCHQAEGQAQRVVFTEDNLCEEFSQRINHKIWGRSLILDYTIRDNMAHPKIFSELERKNFSKNLQLWITN
jgi:hypothetical protein